MADQSIGLSGDSGTKTRIQGRGLRARALISQAATAQFAQFGYGAASIGMIARAAKASKNQIFHHFGSKENLALAVLADCRMAWQSEVFSPADAISDPAMRLIAVTDRIDTLRDGSWQPLFVFASFCASTESMPVGLKGETQALMVMIARHFTQLIESLKEEGTLYKRISSTGAAKAIFNAVLGMGLLQNSSESGGLQLSALAYALIEGDLLN